MAFETSGYLTTKAKISDEEATELTTDTTIPTDTDIDVTVYQDRDGGTTSDNQETVTLSGGDGETNSLSNFESSTDASYWVKIDLSTSDTDVTPEFDLAELNITESTTDQSDTAVKTDFVYEPVTSTETFDQIDQAQKVSWSFSHATGSITGMTVGGSITDLLWDSREGPITRLDTYGTKDVEMAWTSRQSQEAKLRLATAEKTAWSWSPREAPAVIQNQDTTATKEPFSWDSRTARSRRSRRAERDVKWIINDIGTDGLVENHPEVQHGQTSTFTFLFSPRGDPDHDRSHLERYEDVRDIIKIADAAAYGTDEDGRPWFIEQHDSTESILVEVVPGSQSRGAKGVWGIVVGADDQTTTPGEQCVLSLDVFVIANSRAYTDRQAVKKEFQVQRV